MRGLFIKFFYLCLISSFGQGFLTDESYDSLDDIFDSLHPVEKSPFLQYLLIKAIKEFAISVPHIKPFIYINNPITNFSPEIIEKFDNIELPENGLENIYLWYVVDREVPFTGLMQLIANNEYCYPGPEPRICINIDDDANNCCPF